MNRLTQVLVWIFVFVGAGLTQAAGAERPNVVLIMSDDMGWSDLGCYGGEISTPHLDGFARQGVRFTQFYNTGRCCPTRAALLTGLYPERGEPAPASTPSRTGKKKAKR